MSNGQPQRQDEAEGSFSIDGVRDLIKKCGGDVIRAGDLMADLASAERKFQISLSIKNTGDPKTRAARLKRLDKASKAFSRLEEFLEIWSDAQAMNDVGGSATARFQVRLTKLRNSLVGCGRDIAVSIQRLEKNDSEFDVDCTLQYLISDYLDAIYKRHFGKRLGIVKRRKRAPSGAGVTFVQEVVRSITGDEISATAAAAHIERGRRAKKNATTHQ